MIRVRVSFDEKEELEEAIHIVEKIVKSLSDEYKATRSSKVYWNLRDKEMGKENYGGRIYINLERKKKSKRSKS